MTVEASTYINTLDATYPASGDAKSEGDNHLRLIKTAVKATFPNVTGAITPTHTELNFVDGVTSAIQTQIDAKAPSASPTFTGTAVLPATTSIGTVSATELAYVDGVTSAIQTQLDAKAPLASPAFTGTPTAPTAAAGTSTTQIASTAFVAGTAFASALPAQTGNAGKFVTTDGATASWASVGSLTRSARTANTILADADKGTLIDITSGTFSQTFTAAATLGNGWYCYIRNAGTGVITLDPNAAELIDGAATSALNPGEVRLVQCSGTGFSSLLIPVAVSASQAYQEAATDTATFVSPGRQHFHPSAAKVWLKCNDTGAIQASFNVTSVTDTATGKATVTIGTDFSSADYAIVASCARSGMATHTSLTAQAAGTFEMQCYVAGSLTDPTHYFAACFGDQT